MPSTPFPKVRGGKLLSKRKRAKRFGAKVNHLASASYVYAPGKGLDGKKWKLRLPIYGPAKRTSPAAVVVVHLLNGKRQVKTGQAQPRRRRSHKVSFDNRKVGACHGDAGQRLDPLPVRQRHAARLPGSSRSTTRRGSPSRGASPSDGQHHRS